jgi:hypothetical protein
VEQESPSAGDGITSIISRRWNNCLRLQEVHDSVCLQEAAVDASAWPAPQPVGCTACGFESDWGWPQPVFCSAVGGVEEGHELMPHEYNAIQARHSSVNAASAPLQVIPSTLSMPYG